MAEARSSNATAAGWKLPAIPSLPISAEDAAPLLAAMTGPTAPTDWAGTLNGGRYVLGGSGASVALSVLNRFQTKTIWNVLGSIRGA